MPSLFIIILAALGAAFAFRGRQERALSVFTVANATGALLFALEGRWGWMAFSSAGTALCLIGIALVRREA